MTTTETEELAAAHEAFFAARDEWEKQNPLYRVREAMGRKNAAGELIPLSREKMNAVLHSRSTATVKRMEIELPSDDKIAALAKELGFDEDEFVQEYHDWYAKRPNFADFRGKTNVLG